MSMFSFFNNKSPSGSNVSATNTPSTDVEEVKSSFSFISGGGSGNDNISTSTEESTPASSGFSFMTGAPAAPEESAPPVTSGFSFLATPTASEPTVSSQPISSFSFISQPANSDDHTTPMHSPPQKDLMSMEVSQSQDVKFARAASTKVVKKKKKAARVGFGRDEDDDETPAQSVSTTPMNHTRGPIEHPSHVEPAVVEVNSHTAIVTESTVSTSYAEDTNDDLDLPPVPPPSYRAETPRGSIVGMSDGDINHVTVNTGGNDATGDASSMFSGFSFVNNASDTHTSSSAVNQENYQLEEVPATSGFGFIAAGNNTSNHDTTNNEPPATPPVSSFSFLSGAIAEPVVREDIPDTTSSTNDEEQSFEVPSHILKTLHDESRKLGHSIQGFVTLYNSAYDLFTKLMNEVIATSQACVDCTDKIDQLEQQQTILAEREEFEQAAVISAEIEAIQALLVQKTADKDRALENLKAVKAEYDAKRPSVTAVFGHSFDSVFTFVNAAKAADVQGRKKLEDYVKEEHDRLSVEDQRIQMEKSHCEREQATLQSESAVVEDAINTQVGDQLEKKKDLEVQSFSVQEEIRRLEEQLALRRAEEADINKQIKQIDSKILEVRKKYERQLARIAERRDTLQKAQSECALEAHIVAETRQRVDSIVSSALESYRILSIQAETKQQEVKLAETFMKDVQISVDEDDHSFSLDFSWYITESEEIYRCFSTGDHLSSSSKELMERVSKIEQLIRQQDKQTEEQRNAQEIAQSRLKSLVETIDRLEVEKKGHATNKRFKEAANTAKELKEAGEAKEQVEADIKAVQMAIVSMESVKLQTTQELEEARRQLREEQKVEKMIHYNIVRRRMLTSERIKRKVTKIQSKYPSDFTQTLLELYERESDRLQKIRAVLVRECDIDESDVVDTITESDDEERAIGTEINNAETNELLDSGVIGSNDDLVPLTQDPAQGETAFGENALYGETEAYDMSPDNVDLLASSGDHPTEPEEEIAVTASVVMDETPAEPEVDREAVLAEIASVEKDMEAAADAEDYDQAAVLMDKITELKASIGITD